MADTSLAVTTEYVQCFMKLIGKGIAWPEAVVESLLERGLHRLDVTHVITHGDVVEIKENADGKTLVMIGRSCEDVLIRVEFWADENQRKLRIMDVTCI
jgi:hypothetical protein